MPVSALVWNPGVTFNCDNEYYSTTVVLTVDNISISTHWFSVNGIGFNTTAPNPVYINFSSFKINPRSSTGYLMNFTEQHLTEATQYIISGLKPLHNYTWITNSTDYPQTSSASGTLYLNQTGTSRNHKLYDPGVPSGGLFVSLAGSDSTGDGSYSNPYKTIRKALNESTTGDTIQIRGGDYTQPGWTYVGAANHGIIINRNDITITNYNEEKVVIDASAVTFATGYGIFMLYTGATYYNHITIHGINMSNSSYNGITGGGTALLQNDDITITQCSFHNIYNRAINMPGGTGFTLDHLRIANCYFNKIQNNATMNECVTLIGCRDFIFENNTVRNFVKQFLAISGGCYNGTIRYNSFDNKWYYSIKLDSQNNCNNTIGNINIYNNLFFGDAPSSTTHYPISIYINPEAAADGGSTHHINIYNNVFNISTSTASYQCQGFNMNLGTITRYTISYVILKYNTFYTAGSSSSSYDLRVTKGTGTISNSVIANNIFCTDESSPNYQVSFVDLPSSQSSFTITNNQFYNFDGTTSGIDYSSGTDGYGTNGLGTNPQFSSKASQNFHINATSPCVDSASSTYTVGIDYEGNSRPQFTGYDRGAYEYTTGGPAPSASFTFSAISPANTSTGVSLTPTLSVHIVESHGYLFNYTIRENTSVPGTWTVLTSGDNQADGTFSVADAPATAYSTKYWWRVTAVNGTTWHNETYYFTTLAPATPSFTFTGVYPANASTSVEFMPTCSLTINEIHGYLYNFSFYRNNSGSWVLVWGANNYYNMSLGFGYNQATAYDTTYWWRICVVNGTTWHNETYHFTTLPMPAPSGDNIVSSVKANWTTGASIHLSWTKGAGATHTYLYRSTTGYLSGETLLATTTNTYYNDTSKDPTIRYYYTIKAHNATTSTWGNTVNITLAETDNTTSYGASWIDFKGYLFTPRTVTANYHYATEPDISSTVVNVTQKGERYEDTAPNTFSVQKTYQKGQTFTVGNTGANTANYLYNVSVKLLRIGTPGYLYVDLYDANTTGLPTGAALSSGSRNTYEFSTTTPTVYNITMTPYLMTSNTKYQITLRTSTDAGFNIITLYTDATSATYTGGNLMYSDDAGVTWVNYTTFDAYFRIWGNYPTTYPNGLITSNTTVSTTGVYTIRQTGLQPGQIYYYYGTANDTKGNMTKGNTRYSLTTPDVPVFITMTPSFTNSSLYIQWNKGLGANRTVLVDGGLSYPSDPADGTILYNGTGTSTWLHNISFNITYSLSLYSFTVWGVLSRFSGASTVPWGGISFNCYNESSGLPIGFNVLISNKKGDHVYYGPDLYGYQFVNITEIPLGEEIGFYVTNSSGAYKSRMYYFDLTGSIFYNLSFYLPMTPSTEPEVHNRSHLYQFFVYEVIKTGYSEQKTSIDNVLVTIRHYTPTTDTFEIIASLRTDSAGMVSTNLLENEFYKIDLNKTGYHDSIGNDYIATTPNAYGQTDIKELRMILITGSSTIPPKETLWTGITYSLEPKTTRHNGAFTLWFNISSSDSKLEWYRMDVYYVAANSTTWVLISSQNESNASGGSIRYDVENNSGRYSVECWFKKQNYSAYEIYHSGSIIYFITYIRQWASEIPDYAYYIITIVLTTVIMGICLMFFATGIATGYIGLGFMAFMFLLRGDVNVPIDVSSGNPVYISAWIIWGITFLVYTAALFLWSRL